jgi:hypothetical protein
MTQISRCIEILAAFTGSLLLIACSTTHESYAPDGRRTHALNCSGTPWSWDGCYSAAGKLCGMAGYDVLDRLGAVSPSDPEGSNSNVSTSTSKVSVERSMVVACKGN